MGTPMRLREALCRLDLPTRPPIGTVNVYAFTDERVTLIDTGPNGPRVLRGPAVPAPGGRPHTRGCRANRPDPRPRRPPRPRGDDPEGEHGGGPRPPRGPRAGGGRPPGRGAGRDDRSEEHTSETQYR